MAIGGIDIGQELLNVPMGKMIRSMAMAIAEAQWELDKSSMRMAEMMSGSAVLRNRHTDRPITTKSGHLLREDTRVDFGYVYTQPRDGSEPQRDNVRVSMMELGFTPNFYQFVDTIIEVKISISVTGGTEETETTIDSDNTTTDTDGYSSVHDSSYRRNGRWGRGSSLSASWSSAYSRTTTDSTRVQSSQVNASYTSKFGYSAEGASLLRTKLVPVPPPPVLEERIHEVMRVERDYNRWKMLESIVARCEQQKLEASDEDKDKLTAEIESVNAEIKALIKTFAQSN